MGNFLLGCVVGVVTGIVTMSLCVISKQADDYIDEYMEHRE